MAQPQLLGGQLVALGRRHGKGRRRGRSDHAQRRHLHVDLTGGHVGIALRLRARHHRALDEHHRLHADGGRTRKRLRVAPLRTEGELHETGRGPAGRGRRVRRGRGCDGSTHPGAPTCPASPARRLPQGCVRSDVASSDGSNSGTDRVTPALQAPRRRQTGKEGPAPSHDRRPRRGRGAAGGQSEGVRTAVSAYSVGLRRPKHVVEGGRVGGAAQGVHDGAIIEQIRHPPQDFEVSTGRIGGRGDQEPQPDRCSIASLERNGRDEPHGGECASSPRAACAHAAARPRRRAPW